MNSKFHAGAVMTAQEAENVYGGILEKENLYPRKFGAVEVAVYFDGIYMGTARVNPNDPRGPFNPPLPNNL